MDSDFAETINDFREKCARLLQDAQPSTDEHYAYSQILQAFDQDQTSPPDERVGAIQTALLGYSKVLSTPKARAIAQQWRSDFLRDIGKQPKSHGL